MERVVKRPMIVWISIAFVVALFGIWLWQSAVHSGTQKAANPDRVIQYVDCATLEQVEEISTLP